MIQSHSIDGIIQPSPKNINDDMQKSLDMTNAQQIQADEEIIEDSGEPKNTSACCNFLNKYSYILLYF